MTESRTSPNASTIRFGKYRIKLPGTRRQRTSLGIGLCMGGVLGLLPIAVF